MKSYTQTDLSNRFYSTTGAVIRGVDGKLVEVQAKTTKYLVSPADFKSATKIYGMARGAVNESLDRIQGAFDILGVGKTPVSITVNLAPADIVKEGVTLDLPIAVVLLQAAGYLPKNAVDDTYFMFGEIGFNGEIRKVKGALALAYAAVPGQKIISPEGNRKETALVRWRDQESDIFAYPANTLQEVIDSLCGVKKLRSATEQNIQFKSAFKAPIDFADIMGQEEAKEAAVICAAGGHNMIMVGPPGEGKSLIASAMPGILPRLSHAEVAYLTRLYSVSGQLESDEEIVSRRPCRTVTSGTSSQALVGGGSTTIRPGEISLAHMGVLFMDEFPEFRRNTLESLRAPIESGVVRISRVTASIELPARFTLIAAMNPCPCGYHGYGECRCSDNDLRKYYARISGPIIDRIDLKVNMSRLTTEERFSKEKRCSSFTLRRKVERARKRQLERFEGTNIPHNAAIPAGKIIDYCQFSENALGFYKSFVEERTMSTRTMDRLAKVSRTIADLLESETIEIPHIEKAVDFMMSSKINDMFNLPGKKC